ncbi:MAG: type 4a pilus biogenesis protein PilO [Thiotrichales bacterium]|nr:type 4a pilus biogenesis protein PilO [Thiotrichales bacterium]
MTLDELNSLDFQNMGNWPMPVKIALIVLICGGIGFLAYSQDIKGLREAIAKLEQTEIEKIEVLERKQKKAANLQALKEQMKEMKQSFGDMLRQLPDKTEVAGLLVDISQTGLSAGLEFELFKPNKEQPKEFYVELPINLKVNGDYHEFGEFVSGVAALPRIVTAHNIRIEREKGKQDNKKLSMSAIAKTYRALEEEEE